MIVCNFTDWMKNKLNESNDSFTTLHQKEGDLVYFGIHELAKQYKENNSLPTMSMDQINSKKGEITEVDPVDQYVKVAVSKAPFHYGYRKLEGEKEKMRRFMRDDGQMEVKIDVSNLLDITHLVSESDVKIWLVIDSNTSYQKNLIREIRKKEVHRSQNTFNNTNDIEKYQEPPSHEERSHPQTRHYDDYEGDEFSVSDDSEIEHMHVAHFNPSITSNSRIWKHFHETKSYSYFPKK